MNPINIRKLAIGMAVGACACSTLYGETTTAGVNKPVYTLDDFVVVGSSLYLDEVNALKSSTPILDVPQSLSITTAEQLSQQGMDSIGDLIDYTPGLNTSQGEGHRDAVVFRGVRSTADFFIDGVRDDVQYYRPLYNVDRIEILRGSNGLFFGRGGTGGVLNRVMKKAEIGTNFNEYKLTADSFGGTHAQLDTNLSLGDNSALRVNVFGNDLKQHRDFFFGNELGINPTLKFVLNDRATLDFSYEYLDVKRFIDRGIPTDNAGQPVEAFNAIVFGDVAQNYSELTANIFKVNLENNFSDTLKGRLNLTYNNFDKRYQNYYAAHYDSVVSPEVVTLDGYVDTTQRDSWIFSADLISENEFAGYMHKLVAGFEMIETNNDNDRYNTFFDTTNDDQADFTIARPISLKNGVGVDSDGNPISNDFTVSQADATSAEVSVFSIYAQDEIGITDQLDVILGMRYDRIEQSVSGTSNGASSDTELSPRLGIVYKPMQNISIYGSYSTAFEPKSGEQYAKTSSTALDPNTFENQEIGLKWDLNSALSLTAAVFQINKTSPDVDPIDSSLKVDVKSEISGFELQLQGRLNDRWFVSAGYSQLDGEVVENTGPTGIRPRELPEQTFSVWNKFIVTEKLGLGLGLTYQDESFITNSASSAVLPSYTRIDAAAYYTLSDSLSLQLNVENLMDTTYYPNAHSTDQVTVGAPINARIALIGAF